MASPWGSTVTFRADDYQELVTYPNISTVAVFTAAADPMVVDAGVPITLPVSVTVSLNV